MSGEIVVGPERLWELIGKLVRQNSENGRRAQAAVAGLLDVFAEGRVEAGRINDPSRKSPGDVCVRSSVQSDSWEKAIEVRDKPVTEEDVQIFAKKCIDMGVREAAIVMVAEDQRPLDTMSLLDWAISFGVGLTLFSNWRELTGQVLFWAALPKPEAAVQAARHIERRLIAIEASPQAVVYWRELCTAKSSLRE
jgi:hypothetical protein